MLLFDFPSAGRGIARHLDTPDQAAAIERSVIKKYKKTIWHPFVGGCKDYRLINAGDRIAVCVSGGKDSFLLAVCLRHLQKYSDVPFELEFLCMDPGYRPENRALIEENAARMQIPLHFFQTDVFEAAESGKESACYLCGRMRRGYLYKHAQALGCNKIALGHHFDDVIETTLMSMIWGGEVKTMLPRLQSAHYAGMELIRPLYLVHEAQIVAWARYNGISFLQCACRAAQRSEEGERRGARAETKELIAALRKTNPQADMNIFRSMHNINLNMALGWTKDGAAHSFLDEYQRALPSGLLPPLEKAGETFPCSTGEGS